MTNIERLRDLDLALSDGHKAALETRLRAGYGVEDAALAMGLPVREIRAQVALWRADGTLRRWWPKEKPRPQGPGLEMCRG